MTGLHYPDNLYADALAKAELSPTERKLRTARHYLHHALLLVDEVLGQDKQSNHEKLCTSAEHVKESPESERIPKWDPRWGVPLKEQKGYSEGALTSDNPGVYQNQPPNCDGLSARDIRAPHPMRAGVIRDHDERLAGGEDRL